MQQDPSAAAPEAPTGGDGTSDSVSLPVSQAAAADASLIGRIATPKGHEATSEQCQFWARPDRLVEKMQIVRIESRLPGRDVRFYGLVEEVTRRSRVSGIHEAFDATDGDAVAEPPFGPEGVTFATVAILGAEPPVLAPPVEQSRVYLGDAGDAELAYGFGEMRPPIAVGRLRNGGSHFAGNACLDPAYLLGDNGGHLNVNGIPGVGTKSSFLLISLRALMHAVGQPPPLGDRRRHVVPVVFNVKGEDLMFIDQPSRRYDPGRHDADWAALGVPASPFAGATFHAPADGRHPDVPAISGCSATAYGWSLRDVLASELLPFLFAADDLNDLQRGCVADLTAALTERDGTTLRPQPVPQTWGELIVAINDGTLAPLIPGTNAEGTKAAVLRRLRSAVIEGAAIFPRDAQHGRPIDVTSARSCPPRVVSLHPLPSSLQRFVVAAVLRQIVAARTGPDAIPSLAYVLVLDELNRFAPRGGRDPITRLVEEVATEHRSRGIILFGAQQFASEVSTKVVESAATRVLGRTGSAELADSVWRSWSPTARRQASSLRADEKLIMQPTFRAPMLAQVPFPPWAMRRDDRAASPPDQTPDV